MVFFCVVRLQRSCSVSVLGVEGLSFFKGEKGEEEWLGLKVFWRLKGFVFDV